MSELIWRYSHHMSRPFRDEPFLWGRVLVSEAEGLVSTAASKIVSQDQIDEVLMRENFTGSLYRQVVLAST